MKHIFFISVLLNFAFADLPTCKILVKEFDSQKVLEDLQNPNSNVIPLATKGSFILYKDSQFSYFLRDLNVIVRERDDRVSNGECKLPKSNELPKCFIFSGTKNKFVKTLNKPDSDFVDTLSNSTLALYVGDTFYHSQSPSGLNTLVDEKNDLVLKGICTN